MSEPTPHVIIGTWSLWWRFGAFMERHDAITRSATRLDSDVFGPQEVWAEHDREQTTTLPSALGMHVVRMPSAACRPGSSGGPLAVTPAATLSSSGYGLCEGERCTRCAIGNTART
jgi:hypothetical protein